MILRPLKRLPDGSYLAKIYPSSYARDKDRDGIVVRVIEYKLDDPQRTGHGQKHLLLTNLLDHEKYPCWNWPASTMSAGKKNWCLMSKRRTRTRVDQASPRSSAARRLRG